MKGGFRRIVLLFSVFYCFCLFVFNREREREREREGINGFLLFLFHSFFFKYVIF